MERSADLWWMGGSRSGGGGVREGRVGVYVEIIKRENVSRVAFFAVLEGRVAGYFEIGRDRELLGVSAER
jgi:hypothetical protein